ncbi:hypothetical protein SETIT_2G245100v2 [Setaria italica]|nr:probable E3 ubiquitin-protein ligase XERICO [Setaria italica]RCV12136.1 hypothetical protein SETIT_2G245100v2 [Setaria italica]
MGISSMPEPRDSLLGFLVYNAVISIAALAGLVRAALVFLDLGDWEADGAVGSGDRLVPAASGPAERLQRSLLRPARLGPIPGVTTTTCGAAAAAAGDDCSVCLAGFEAGAVVNRLPCGHVFHRGCLETWLRYERATCPLCRARVPIPADEAPGLRYPECE